MLKEAFELTYLRCKVAPVRRDLPCMKTRPATLPAALVRGNPDRYQPVERTLEQITQRHAFSLRHALHLTESMTQRSPLYKRAM